MQYQGQSVYLSRKYEGEETLLQNFSTFKNKNTLIIHTKSVLKMKCCVFLLPDKIDPQKIIVNTQL